MASENKQLKLLQQIKEYTFPNYTNINFGYRNYTFSIVQPDDIPGLDGKADFSDGVIKVVGHGIDSCDSIPRMRETIYHEIFHVILDLLGYGESEDSEPFLVSNEELTTAISRGWMLFENLNPEFHKFMMDLREFDQ